MARGFVNKNTGRISQACICCLNRFPCAKSQKLELTILPSNQYTTQAAACLRCSLHQVRWSDRRETALRYSPYTLTCQSHHARPLEWYRHSYSVEFQPRFHPSEAASQDHTHHSES